MYLVVTIIDTFYSSFLWLYIDTQKKASLNFVHGVLQGQTAPHSHPSNTDCNIDLTSWHHPKFFLTSTPKNIFNILQATKKPYEIPKH